MISEGLKQKFICAGWFPNYNGSYENMHKHYKSGELAVISGCGLTIQSKNGKSETYYVETIKDVCELLKANGIRDFNLEGYQ